MHRGERADRRDDQREDQALVAERGLAEDQRGDQRHGVGLEQVGGHAGAVADVVADVVGDGGGVARVVLGDALLDLADQVGADVGGLGEDAAADPHEHREQRGAEAEALEHVGAPVLVDQHDDRGAEQAEADGEHADDAAGAERDPAWPARGRPRSRAAAATRTLARTASHMPR